MRLQFAGHTLQAAYGRHFTKVLQLIHQTILMRLMGKDVMPHLLDLFFAQHCFAFTVCSSFERSSRGTRCKLPMAASSPRCCS